VFRRSDRIPEANLDSELRDLIFRFFYRFSRFEFALKRRDFLKSHAPGARADPSWADFIEKFREGYEQSVAAKGLVEANPKREVVGENGHGLSFAEVDPGDSDLAQVVALARTVRNNLFHGGKYDSEGWDNPARIRKLVDLSTKVLDELADRADLNGDYTGEY
jgi:hypothetical protein